MLMRFKYLRQHPRVFRSVTGLTIPEFKGLLGELRPFFEAHEAKRLAHPDRIRAPGAGHPWGLDYRDSVLLTLVWLRLYPTGVVLGYFFDASHALQAGATIFANQNGIRILISTVQSGFGLIQGGHPHPGLSGYQLVVSSFFVQPRIRYSLSAHKNPSAQRKVPGRTI